MRDSFLPVNGLQIHYVEEGPKSGPLVLLLHGFPEFWFSWRHQIPALAVAGFRVVAPDLRGYNLSDKPPRVADYDLDLLAGDVVGLIEGLGASRAALVGHDWGGAVAWHTAAHHPQRISRLAVLDCPPPQAMARALLRDPAQTWRSWYMFLFQLPLLPEWLIGGPLFRTFTRSWTTRVEAIGEAELARYQAAAVVPGAMRSAIHYYRAALRRWRRTAFETPTKVQAPTLVLWGEKDRILRRQLIDDLGPYVDGPVMRRVVPGAGHFLQQEAPKEVNRELWAFLGPLLGGAKA